MRSRFRTGSMPIAPSPAADRKDPKASVTKLPSAAMKRNNSFTTGGPAPLSTTTRARDAGMESVLNDVRSTLKNDIKPLDNVPRKVTRFLQDRYDLGPHVRLDEFQTGDSVEDCKVGLAVVLATQQTASTTLLETKVLGSNVQALEALLESAQTSSQQPGKSRAEDIHALELQVEQAHTQHSQAVLRHDKAQARFEKLRDAIAHMVMDQLNTTAAAFDDLFSRIDDSELHKLQKEVDAVVRRKIKEKDDDVLRQSRDLHAAPPSPTDTMVERSSPDADSSSIEYLHNLYAEAIKAQRMLQTALSTVQEVCSKRSVQITVEMGGIKPVERSIEKAELEYEGDYSRLLDIARGSVICNSASEAAVVIDVIANLKALTASKTDKAGLELVDVVRIKNKLDPRYDSRSDCGGYRDVLLNVKVRTGHVCELVIHIASLMVCKTHSQQHIHTLAKSLGMLSPLALAVVTPPPATTTQDNVQQLRDQVSTAIAQVDVGLCHNLQLSNVRLTSGEWESLRDAVVSRGCGVVSLGVRACGSVELPGGPAPPQPIHSSLRHVDIAQSTVLGIASILHPFIASLSLRDCDLKAVDTRLISTALKAPKARALTLLDLSDNKIGDEGAREIAGVLEDSEGLTHLNLAATKIYTEGANALVPVLSRLANITYLNLSGCIWETNLGGPGAQALAPALAGMTNLASLVLNWVGLEPAGVKALATSLAQTKGLTCLSLDGNAIKDEGVSYLATCLPSLEFLQVLDLDGNGICDSGATALAGALPSLALLTSLRLGGNTITGEGMLALGPALAANAALTHLDLAGNSMGASGAQALAPALSKMPRLAALILAGAGITHEGSQHIGPSLAHLVQLTNLDLAENMLGVEGAKLIAETLSSMTHITSLDLSNNSIGDEGAGVVCPALASKQLTTLNLSWNGIGAVGAEHIAGVLQGGRLHDLALAGNTLGSDGVKALAAALPNANHLTALTLSGSRMGDEGATELSRALANLTNLSSLRLEDNSITNAGLAVLEPVLVQLSGLTALNLLGNEFDENAREGLRSRFPHVTELSV